MINPVFVYISAWALVLILYSFDLTSNLVEVSGVGLLVILLNVLSISVIAALVLTGKRRVVDDQKAALYVATVKSFVKACLFIWMAGSVIEIIVCRGFPLYWKFVGDTRLYTDFGIPSFHGVINAFFLQSLTMAAFLALKLRQKRWLFLAVLLLAWPIAMLGRGILLSGLLQIVCVLLLMTRISFRKILLLGLVGVSVILAFGYLGDLRQTANPFSYLLSGTSAEFFKGLPSGFLWFYVYLTAGLSNFFYNVDTLMPAWGVSYSLSNMLPSVVRTFFDLDPHNDLFQLVDQNLNTSTIYAGSVSDFGPVGGFLMVAIVQFVCCYIYSLTRSGKPWGIFAYTVAFQILVFSIFYDMFFLLPTLFQFAICFLLYLYYRYRLFASESRSRSSTGTRPL